MYIMPAIDLMDQKCVRLVQGDYNRQITYEIDPVKKANEFISAGAGWVHVIDLDGARVGKPINTESIKAIAVLGKLKIEVGGGVRSEDAIKELLDIGVERVIIGTKAFDEFQWFSDMAEKFEGRLALGLDARGSRVATHGWTKDDPHDLLEFAVQAAKLPLAVIIYTDITKDGMLAGPNLERTKAVAEAVSVPVTASGGIKEISDIHKLLELNNIEAAIIGRALYEGTIELSEAIEATK